MNFFQRWFQRKQSQIMPMVVVNQLGRPARSKQSYETLSKEGYEKNVIAFRCINFISKAISRMPICLYRMTDEGPEEVENHPAKMILNNPNPMQDGVQFMFAVAAYLHIKGDSFIEVATDNRGTPQFLYAIRPDRIAITPGANGIPASYTAIINGAKKEFPVTIFGVSDIMHTKFFHPTDDWFGMSPLEAAAYEIDQINEANNWNYALLKNSAAPSGVLRVKADQYNTGTLTADQRKDLKQQLNEMYSGSGNSGRPMVLEGNMEWQSISMSPREMDYLENKKTSKSDIAQAYGLPPQIIGIEGSQTFSNYEQAQLSAYVDTIIPAAEQIISLLNHKFLVRFPDSKGLFFKIDRDQIDALSILRDKMWERAEKANFISPNEKRALLDYGKYEESDDAADKIYMPGSLQPLEMLGDTGSMDDGTDSEDLLPPEDEPTDEPTEEPIDDEIEDEESDLEEGKSEKFQVFGAINKSQQKKAAKDRMRIQESMERKFARRVRNIFDIEKNAIIKNAGDGKNIEAVVNSVLDRSESKFKSELEKHLSEVGEAFGKEIIKQVTKSNPELVEVKASDDVFDTALRSFVRNQSGRKISRIQQVTRRRVVAAVRKSILQANETGEDSARLVKKSIQAVYKSFSAARANTIARTETHNAALYAMQKGAESLRIPGMKKTWVAANDDRTRESHADIDGTEVDLKENFLVPNPDGSPDEMIGPGDQSAPPEQVINCRCVLTYSIGE
jgi:HK97 family phage portal protein